MVLNPVAEFPCTSTGRGRSCSTPHVRITLEPTNLDFEPIEVDDEDSVAVVAELIEALGTDPPE